MFPFDVARNINFFFATNSFFYILNRLFQKFDKQFQLFVAPSRIQNFPPKKYMMIGIKKSILQCRFQKYIHALLT
jgi:hypothetical protein